MRPTQCLLRESMKRKWKLLWKHRGALVKPQVHIAAAVREAGIQPVAVEDLFPKKEDPRTSWVPPVSNDPRFAEYYPPSREEDHPDWHADPAYMYHDKITLFEGEAQAQLLTNTVLRHGLPEAVQALVTRRPELDVAVQQALLQANEWDPEETPLPRRINFANPGWKYRAEYGTLPQRSCNILMTNLLPILLRLALARQPAALSSRCLLTDTSLCSHTRFNGQMLLTQHRVNWSVLSRDPLPPSATDPERTAAEPLPDLTPVSPLIDLQVQNLYQTRDTDGRGTTLDAWWPHTLIRHNIDYHSTASRTARAVLTCYSACAVKARQLYGTNVGVLPEPISVQCVHTDGIRFHFVVFQLNTLLEGDQNVRNIAWLDTHNMLYNKTLVQTRRLKGATYSDYDHVTFDKLCAFYLHGLR